MGEEETRTGLVRPPALRDPLLHAGLGLAVLALAVLPFDRDLLRLINPSGAGSLGSVARFIDLYLPRILLLAGMVLGLACWFSIKGARHRRAGMALALLPFLASAAMSLPKRLVGRPRPQLADWDRYDLQVLVELADTRSFPSGHVTTATAFAIVAGWMLAGRTGKGLVLLLIPLMIWDRTVCLVHYPSDAVAGAAAGCLAAFVWRQTLSGHDPRPGPVLRFLIGAALGAFTVILWRDVLLG